MSPMAAAEEEDASLTTVFPRRRSLPGKLARAEARWTVQLEPWISSGIPDKAMPEEPVLRAIPEEMAAAVAAAALAPAVDRIRPRPPETAERVLCSALRV